MCRPQTSARSLRTPRLLASPRPKSPISLASKRTLRKHFREELNSGKFKVDMLAGKTVTELMKDRDAMCVSRALMDFCCRGLDRVPDVAWSSPSGFCPPISCKCGHHSSGHGRHQPCDAQNVERPSQIVDERRQAELGADLVEAAHECFVLLHSAKLPFIIVSSRVSAPLKNPGWCAAARRATVVPRLLDCLGRLSVSVTEPREIGT